MKPGWIGAVLAAALAAGPALAQAQPSAEALVRAALARIVEVDTRGPTLRSVLAVNPAARADARALDGERRQGRVRSPLHGVPILIKDNVEVRELPTTAGSLALAANRTGRDAPIVARLRAAGLVMLGKSNLSEWANFRSTDSSSGWSAMGGLTRNPHAIDRTACGSSSGSGAAVAAGIVRLAIGTETDGSITCPASVNGIVGFKPTVGWVPRTHIVPISSTQDTAGPMTRTVREAALLMDAIAGPDAGDAATAAAPPKPNFAATLSADALRGKRIGVLRFATGTDARVDAVFDRALATLRAAGAETVDIKEYRPGQPRIDPAVREAEGVVLLTEFKADLDAYLATTPPTVTARTLADLIASNTANATVAMPLFAQELFVQAQATTGKDDPAYLKARETAKRLAGADGIDRLLRETKVDLLVFPTRGPAWTIDLVNGDPGGTGYGAPGSLAAVAGYPHLTVPMGAVQGLPVGLSFVGAAWTDAAVLAAGYAYQQAANVALEPRLVRTDALPGVAPALLPQSR